METTQTNDGAAERAVGCDGGLYGEGAITLADIDAMVDVPGVAVVGFGASAFGAVASLLFNDQRVQIQRTRKGNRTVLIYKGVRLVAV